MTEFCPNCGKKVVSESMYCLSCGKSLQINPLEENIQAEKEIFKFGPKGTMLCLSRPSTFSKARVNMSIILTNKRIYAVNKFLRTKIYLELPIDSILSMEPISYSRFKGIFFHYKVGSENKEIGIMGDKNNYGNVAHLVDLLTKMGKSP